MANASEKGKRKKSRKIHSKCSLQQIFGWLDELDTLDKHFSDHFNPAFFFSHSFTHSKKKNAASHSSEIEPA